MNRLSLLITLCSAALPAAAQDTIALTLGDAREKATAHAIEARLAKTRIGEAEATRVGAGVWLPVNPMVNFDARHGGSFGPGYGGAVNVMFDGFGAPQARVREADLRVDTAEAEADKSKLESRLAATSSYVATALARLEMEHARESIALAERLVRAARERQTAGAGSAVDVTSAEAELAERKAQLHAAIATETLEQMGLRANVGLYSISGTLALTSAIELPASAPEVATMLATAREKMPDLKVSQARLALLDAADERLSREALPKLGAYAGVDSAPASPIFGILGVQLELPIAQRNQGRRAVNAAEQRTERERLEYINQLLELQLSHRREAHEAARSELEVIVGSGIPNAAERLRLVEEGWRAGRFDVFKVTTAANDLVRLKTTRIDALRRIWGERLALERLIGGWVDGQ
ncbi:MAG: TolC family protein [Myxococcaceae bacterium]|nr:TolC family protein [Myxococcaceae bacterium]